VRSQRLHWVVFLVLVLAICSVIVFWGGMHNAWAALVAGNLIGTLAYLGHPLRRRKP